MKSSEYWQNPRCDKKVSEKELAISVPKFYTDPALQPLSIYLTEHIQKYVDPKERILEIGCNVGRNIEHLILAGYENVTGVEISPEAVEASWRYFPKAAPRIHCADARAYLAVQPSKSFYMIFTQSILMHVPPEDKSLFVSMARVAGSFILTNEVERNSGPLMKYKWNRNYQEVFKPLGWKQIHVKDPSLVPKTRHSTTRIFSR